jgi:hypothetical protein
MNEKINTERELIIKSLNREYKDSNPYLYIYIRGATRARQTAINNILKYTDVIFYNCQFNENFVKLCIAEYLDYKKEQYIRGEIKIKSFY